MQDPPAPTPARLLLAGQRGEVLATSGVLERCRPANISGKGRGLIARETATQGELLLLEPPVAVGSSYAEVAAELCRLVLGKSQDDGSAGLRDDILLEQLLSLSCVGQDPTSVSAVPEDANSVDDFMRRLPARQDAEKFAVACELLGASEEDLAERLLPRLRKVAENNSLRGTADLLGSVAWLTLSPSEQRGLLEADPTKVPSPKLWFFLRASLANHSEAPNAHWSLAGGMVALRAARDIGAGEEVQISYWPDLDAADATAQRYLESFSLTPETLGPAPELDLSVEQQTALRELKRIPFDVASQLAGGGAGDPADLFDQVSKKLASQLVRLEETLPLDSRAFLEPRVFQAQLNLQQAAIKTARGDAQGELLSKLGLARLRSALQRYTSPWSARVLLRLLFTLKGVLRPTPEQMVASAVGDGSENFAVQLARQARVSPLDVDAELKRAVQVVFGDEAILPSVLAKCGFAE